MNRDFTCIAYSRLLEALAKAGYSYMTFAAFIQNEPSHKAVVLRHDVDSWPQNANQMADIEFKHNARATYFFRRSVLSFNEKIIKSIVQLGHEVGYHYEDLAACNGNMVAALKRFQKNLEFYRQFYPINTIAMHGRPLSKWDSKDLWTKYRYQDFGIVGEPYIDLDFNKVLYLTDTGNCWDGDKYSVRDYVQSPFKFNIHTTWDLIEHIEKNLLPDQMMLNIHPARWNDNCVKWWIRYYVLTLPKFQIKKLLKRNRLNTK